MVQMMYDAIGSMTGGLITDIYTVMLALFGIGFLCMGFDFIKDAFASHLREKRHAMTHDEDSPRDQSVSLRGSSRDKIRDGEYD